MKDDSRNSFSRVSLLRLRFERSIHIKLCRISSVCCCLKHLASPTNNGSKWDHHLHQGCPILQQAQSSVTEPAIKATWLFGIVPFVWIDYHLHPVLLLRCLLVVIHTTSPVFVNWSVSMVVKNSVQSAARYAYRPVGYSSALPHLA